MILTLALLGELLDHETPSGEATAFLFGGGLTILLAHLFSASLGHMVSTGKAIGATELLQFGREEIGVVVAALITSALMLAAAIVGVECQQALRANVLLGLVTPGLLSQRAVKGRRWPSRLGVGLSGAVLGAIIVTLENIV